MDDPEYETVWNGGEGLTTVGAQRPGAVRVDVVGGCVTDWMDVQEWQRAHATIGARAFPRGLRLGAGGLTGGAVADRIVVHDLATTPDRIYRWLETVYAARWSRVLQYSRWVGFPACHLCRHPMPAHTRSTGKRGGPMAARIFHTPCHRCVCERCYVLYRMARGRWKGAQSLVLYVRLRLPPSGDPRTDRRRALGRAQQRRAYLRKKAAKQPRSA